MFQHYSPGDLMLKRKTKSIVLMQNGNPSKLFQYEFSKGLSKEELLRMAEKNWGGSSYKNMRIFSIDAVEYFDEDLLYVKNGQRFYLSRGEEFDSNSNFGQYEMVKKLGQGGFGSVELAKNIITGDLAAIKILKTNKNSTSTDIDMIFKEAQNLKSLNHPNIVKIINCYAMSDMRVVIVMEYLEEGELLGFLKKRGKFDQILARSFFKQITQAVVYCHRQGIIHRDLKLENILMKNEKVIKVADFGISGVADRFNPEADWGTLKYMSPQVLSGKHKLNSKGVDVWACGVILYFMVTGKLPFDGTTSSEIIDNIVKKPVQFPEEIPLTLKCKNLINRILNKNPEERITMSDIEADPWVINRQERISNILKTTASQEYCLRLTDNKKQQRKSINLPKPNNVKIPKRLEKEKDKLIEELREYKMQKRSVMSHDKKLFPTLRQKQKNLDLSKARLKKPEMEDKNKKSFELFRK